MRNETERAEFAIWAMIAIFCFTLAALSIWGCTPSAGATSFSTIMAGQYQRPLYYQQPYPYIYPPPRYQSMWMGPPRANCFQLGQFVRCQQI